MISTDGIADRRRGMWLMPRKWLMAGLLAAAAGAAFIVVAPRVDAATAVTVTGTTITVTDTDGADVHRLASGETDVDGTVYPERPNLVVKSLASPTVLLDSVLTGSLTISTAVGRIELGGSHAVIHGDLKVSGGMGTDVVWLTGPLLVHGDASFDLKAGLDYLFVSEPFETFGAIEFKGSNRVVLGAPVLAQGDVSFNSKTDTQSTEVSAIDSLQVGGDFSFHSGKRNDSFSVGSSGSALFTHDATFSIGNAAPGETQLLDLGNTIVNGRLNVRAGTGGTNRVLTNAATVVGRSADVRLTGAVNEAELRGTWNSAQLVKYAGGGGSDAIGFLVEAPNAKVVVNTSTGDDSMTLNAVDSDLGVLVANFGGGTDVLDLGGFVLPPGSTVKNVP
jgi:hypothetical protein